VLDIGARCGGSSWGSPWGGGVGVTTAMTGPDEATCGGGDSTQDGVEVGALWSSLLSPSRDSPHPSRRLDMLNKCLSSLRLILHRDEPLLNGVPLTKMRL